MRTKSGPMSQSGSSGGSVSFDQSSTAAKFDSVAVYDAGADHTITFDTATDEAANRTITIPALGANVTLSFLDLAQTFTAQKVFETGAAGASPVIFRQTGGTPGTDDLELAHNGSNAVYDAKSGSHYFRGPSSVPSLYLEVPGTFSFGWTRSSSIAVEACGGQNIRGISSSGTEIARGKYLGWASFGVALDVAMQGISGAPVVVISDGTLTGGGWMQFIQSTDLGTPATNSAGIGAEDGGGTAELVAVDEAGNETIISPHVTDGPAELYDEIPGIEEVSRSINRYSGRVVFVNHTRRDKCIETGERKQVRFEESLEDYCTRTGRVKPLRDWDADQEAKQAAYDADRASEQARAAEAATNHTKALAAYAKLPAAEKAKQAAPVAQVVNVRPAKNVRKPRPAWLKGK